MSITLSTPTDSEVIFDIQPDSLNSAGTVVINIG